MTYAEVGERIRFLRKKMGLNQEQLAELARLNRVTIAKYESGKVEPGAQALTRIADALEVTVDELLGRDTQTGEAQSEAPKTLEARIVSFGMDKLPQEERQKILDILQRMYDNNPDIFKRSDEDEA